MSEYNIFAYGSNLSKPDWGSYCSSVGFDPERLLPIGPAVLPDHYISFDRHSETRRGGVLNVRHKVGMFTAGALFKTDDEGLRILRRKEGVAVHAYQEKAVIVIDEEGCEVRAITFEVPKSRIEPFRKPSEQYLQVCLDGYRRFELDETPLLAAARGEQPAVAAGFFSYGTLMRGEARFTVVSQYDIRSAIMATVLGNLFDAGRFPILDLRGDSFVAGDLFNLGDLEGFLLRADEIEGFHGFGRSESLFRRALSRVDVGGIGQRVAWMYVRDDDRFPGIPGGDWRVHKGVDVSFRENVLLGHFGHTTTREGDDHLKKDFLDDSTRLPMHRRVDERSLAQISGNWRACCGES